LAHAKRNAENSPSAASLELELLELLSELELVSRLSVLLPVLNSPCVFVSLSSDWSESAEDPLQLLLLDELEELLEESSSAIA
jgi:hypothetical protein